MIDQLLIIPYKQRLYKWPSKGPNRSFSNDDELYSWMINDWIPKQPDSNQLMVLFIRLKFSLREFIKAVGPGPGSGTRKKKVA